MSPSRPRPHLPDRPPSLLFITRKYPPGRGGMEEFSRALFDVYPGHRRLIALHGPQAWLPAVLLRAVVAARRRRGGFRHVHLGDGMLTPLAPLLERLSGAPVTATLHGLDITRTTPGYHRLIARALRRLPNRLVAVSSYTAAQAEALFGVRAHVITNGVDVARFDTNGHARDQAATRRRLGLPESGPLVVTVGRLVARKGVAWFISSVLSGLPERVTYAVAGDGPHRRAVQAAAARDERVRLLGEVDDATVAALYGCADLFVAPNIVVPGHPEGYGIAPGEAAAAGVPVLVSDLEGLRDMALDTGVRTVPPGDPTAWQQAVRAALADPDAFRARRPPRTWSEVGRDYARFFEAVAIEGSRAARSSPPT